MTITLRHRHSSHLVRSSSDNVLLTRDVLGYVFNSHHVTRRLSSRMLAWPTTRAWFVTKAAAARDGNST